MWKRIGAVLRILGISAKWVVRILALIVVLLALTAATGAYIVHKMFTPEHLTAILTDQLQNVLHRPVQLESVRVVVFEGIKIKSLKVLDPGSKDGTPLISCGSMTVKYDFLSLLQSKMLLTEILMESPKINIVRREDGTWNCAGLIRPPEDNSPTTIRYAAGLTFQLDVRHGEINDATVTIRDMKTNNVTMFYDVKLMFLNFGFTRDFTYRLACMFQHNVGDSVFTEELYADGLANLAGMKWDSASLTKSNIQVNVGKKPIEGTMELNNFINPEIDFSIEVPYLNKTDFSLFPKFPAGLSLPASRWKGRLLMSSQYKKLELKDLKGTIGPLRVSGDVSLDFTSPSSVYDIVMKSRMVNVEDLVQYYSPIGKYKPAGPVSFALHVFSQDGKPQLDKLQITSPGGLNFKWAGFVCNNLGVIATFRNNFATMSFKINNALVKISKQEFDAIKGWVEYADGNLFVNDFSGRMNGSYFKTMLEVYSLLSDNRKILMNTYMAQMALPSFFVTVEDIAAAIPQHHGGSSHVDHSSLSWLRTFRSGQPQFMPNFRGSLLVDRFNTPFVSGRNFSIEYNLKGLLPGMKKLDGTIRAELGPGVIFQLDKMAEQEKALGVAFMPFRMMHKMERAGAFKVGSVLRDVQYRKMGLETAIDSGTTDVTNFYIDGSSFSARGYGKINWVQESMDVGVDTLFNSVNKYGGLSESMTDVSGKPALSFVIKGPMENLGLTMNRPKTVGAEVQKAIGKGVGTDFSKIKKFAHGG